MPIKDRKEADQFPLTATNVLFYYQAIFHGFSEPHIVDLARVVPCHLKGQVSNLYLAVQV